jgi:hypothetical protein
MAIVFSSYISQIEKISKKDAIGAYMVLRGEEIDSTIPMRLQGGNALDL